MLYQLIYYSTASKAINEGQLYTLLAESNCRNESNSITGMLAYIEGIFDGDVIARFMQVLEGSKQHVQATFLKIKKDPRHYNVCLIKQEFILKRSFGEWSMKFEKINLDAYPGLLDFFTLDQDLLRNNIFGNGNAALDFLKSF
jgi:hypothetical protein